MLRIHLFTIKTPQASYKGTKTPDSERIYC